MHRVIVNGWPDCEEMFDGNFETISDAISYVDDLLDDLESNNMEYILKRVDNNVTYLLIGDKLKKRDGIFIREADLPKITWCN